MHVALHSPQTRRILGTRYHLLGDIRPAKAEARIVLIGVQLLGKWRSYDMDLPYETATGWPGLHGTPEACRMPRYRLGWYHDRAAGVHALYFEVDLSKRIVVDVSTVAVRHVSSWAQGKPHPSCPQKGGKP